VKVRGHRIDAVAKEISAAGGVTDTAQVAALDEQAVEKHTGAVAEKTEGVEEKPLYRGIWGARYPVSMYMAKSALVSTVDPIPLM
jgi:hypothetical protein